MNEYEYKLRLEDLKYDKPWVLKNINGTEVETTYPFGLVDYMSVASGKELKAKDIVLYLPGKKIKELPAANGSEYNVLKKSNSEVLTKAVLYMKDTGWAFVEREHPFRRVSVEDETVIKEIIDNGYVLGFSKLVKSKPVMNADFLYVNQFNPGELIDYYNTYKGDKTYQLEDVIKALHAPAKKVSVPLKDYTEEQWRKLANDKKSPIEWFYSQADKAFYEVAKGGRGGGMPPLFIEPSNQWRITDNGIEVSTNYAKFLFKKNNKQYNGGLKHMSYYVSKTTYLYI